MNTCNKKRQQRWNSNKNNKLLEIKSTLGNGNKATEKTQMKSSCQDID